MAVSSREQALSLLAAANNHGDLAVKLSSLKQVKDILLSVEPSLVSEILPYLAELQSSPEGLVRKALVEMVEEIGLKVMEHSVILMPIFVAFLKDADSMVARQTIVSGKNLFCSVLEEMALQFHRHGKVEKWIEELWMWMVKFKDAVFAIVWELGSVGTRLLAVKFLETCVLLFTPDTNISEKSTMEGNGRPFNISWLVSGHPILDSAALTSEANRTLGVLLSLLKSANSLPGSLTITAVNCLASIARKRPLLYGTILSALFDFDPNFEMMKGVHASSIQYSLRTAFLGFLRCTHPLILESRDRLVRALRAMNAMDAADQAIRQVDKMIKNTDRASRDARLAKDEQLSSQPPVSSDLLKKRFQDNEEPTNSHEMAPKRIRYGPNTHSTSPAQISDSREDKVPVNGVSPMITSSDSELTHVEQMIAIIGALLAEGERGEGSLEFLLSNIQSDLLADIVITNMKHLPKAPPPLTRVGNFPVTRQTGPPSNQAQLVAPNDPTSAQSSVPTQQIPFSSATAISTSLSDLTTVNNLPMDSRRDPRRDPRRLDPRRVAEPIGISSIPIVEGTGVVKSEFDGSVSLSQPLPLQVVTSIENPSGSLMAKTKSVENILESTCDSEIDHETHKEEVTDEIKEILPIPEVNCTSDLALSSVCTMDEDPVAPVSLDIPMEDSTDTVSLLKSDQHSPDVSNTSVSEETCSELPLLPLYVDLTEEEQRRVRELAIERVIESYKHVRGTDYSQTRMALLARLVAQIDADDDAVVMLHKHIILDYQNQKGHELVLHVLYHLHTRMISDSDGQSSSSVIYEKFLLAVAKSLLDTLPASDKSFSRLLGEVPLLPDSALKLLDDICYLDVTDHHGEVVRDADRVTQGLGAVWSLILARPLNRHACLNIALKCAVHSQEDIRTKAIRLVANKLYQLSYVSETIEQFATNMLMSAVDQRIPDIEFSQALSSELKAEGEETSTSGSQISESATSENDSVKGAQSVVQSVSTMSPTQALRLISLFFALCIKKPSLLQLVFNNYGRAPKTFKQAVYRHIATLIRALGSSCLDLFRIISDPPQGSEDLLMKVLQILTEETTPSPDLIATVKYLYETKLKDASILIPMLSSLSKKEVLPIFPRLVDLPLDKFQKALAHILQGSAHTGPALTPAEVLVALHGISPEKDGIALKKITDTCSACFEQRTVFTQQVLAKALSQMVDQSPLPLLFMRTVIQAIDAFPTLVDFVMEILSKLVNKQVWRMPKLWVGFLKCVSQTQPHSFHVLLKLPPPQLESALNKYAIMREPLAAYASQPSVKSSLHRSTLVVLGLSNEMSMQQPRLASLHPADATSSSVHGTTLT